MLPERIETSRLVLSPWCFEDLPDLMAYATDPAWGFFLPVPQPYTEVNGRQFLASTLLLDRAAHVAWCVRLDGRSIGGVNIRIHEGGRIGELGYSIAPAHWGKGYASEAAGSVVQAAFGAHPQMVRIRALADVRNDASRRVLEKIGMTLEGVLKQNRLARNELMDEAWYAVMRAAP